MAVLVRRHVRIVIGKIRHKLGDDHAHPAICRPSRVSATASVGRRDARRQRASPYSARLWGNPDRARSEIDAFRDRKVRAVVDTLWRGFRSTARSSRPRAFDPAM